MCKKIFYLVSIMLIMNSVGNAADVKWTGAGGDRLWTNPANWEFNKVPTVSDNVFLNAPAAKNGPIYQDGMNLKINGLSTEVAGESTMTMTGGTLEITDYIWWGDDNNSHATFTMSGGTITVGNEFELGWGGGHGTWIMTGGSVTCGELVVPTATGAAAELYLHGGTINVGSDGLQLQPVGMIDVGDGVLILEGDRTEQINTLVEAGRITFYSGSGRVVLDYDDRNPGKTTLSARWTGNAYNPSPADGAYYANTWVTLSWSADDSAASHDVYMADNYDDVYNGTGDAFRGNQVLNSTFYVAGFPGYAFPDGLVPGTTYYWRIDEVEADGITKHKGDVWSFTIPPKTAYNPVPADGAEFVALDTTLSWTVGYGGKLHTVYIGTDFDDVNDASDGTSQGPATYTPDQLEPAIVYYWRVDEYDGDVTYKGDVWSFTTPGAVGKPVPANGTADVKMTATLSWTAADNAASHEVYFGSDKDAVRNADKNSLEYKGSKALGAESYDPGKLSWYTNYYWRIDEVDSLGNTQKGPLWSFTTADFISIDDFEDYNAGENQIWYAWHDGLGYGTPDNPPYSAGNGTGSAVGDETTPSYCEETIVHGGKKSMPVAYDNNKQGYAYYSEVAKTLTYPRDWTEEGVGELTVWFRGKADNDAEPLYVAVSNSVGSPAIVVNNDPAAAQVDVWTKWIIPLQSFADQGIDLTDVDSIAIGLGAQGNLTTPGGAGKMYFDDIQLDKPAPEPVVNLLSYGGFEDGAATPLSTWAPLTWSMYGEGGSMEVVSQDAIEGDYCLKVTVAAATANIWDIGFKEGGVVFEAGKSYTLSAWFKSQSGPLEINLKLERDADPYDGYEQLVTISDEWAQYSLTSDVIPETVDPASATFHVGYAAGEFLVDDIVLTAN
jgi:hypothetical protein